VEATTNKALTRLFSEVHVDLAALHTAKTGTLASHLAGLQDIHRRFVAVAKLAERASDRKIAGLAAEAAGKVQGDVDAFAALVQLEADD
jgi:hypothetical protein